MKNSAIINLDTAPKEVTEAIKTAKQAQNKADNLSLKMTEARNKAKIAEDDFNKAYNDAQLADDALSAAIKVWGV